MRRVLPPSFFERDARVVARELLGKFLVRRTQHGAIEAMITETEAYTGPDDLACHAARGRTARTEPLFGPPGRFYVYFVYGMHWMFNVVTGEEGHPAAVLIRGVEGVTGPARLTKHFGIGRSFNALPASRETGLWFEDRGLVVSPRDIVRTPRVGVDYAGAWAPKLYRFVLRSKQVVR